VRLRDACADGRLSLDIVGGAALVLGALAPVAGGGWSSWPAASALLSLPLNLAYFTIAHGSRRGQTLGDWVNRIAVRGEDGPTSYGQAFGRTVMIGLFLGLFFVGGFLDFLWPLWDHRRQAWHDKVAGTIVVRS